VDVDVGEASRHTSREINFIVDIQNKPGRKTAKAHCVVLVEGDGRA